MPAPAPTPTSAPTSHPARPDPRRTRAGRTRDRLLHLAREHLAATGAPPPLADLARTAGVGVGTVYRAFATPDDLLAALGEPGLETLVTSVAEVSARDDPARALAYTVALLVRAALADPGVATLLHRAAPPPRPDVPAARPAGPAALALTLDHLVARARGCGAAPADLTGDDLRRLALGLVHALEPRPGPASARPPTALVARYVDVLVAGLQAVPRRGG